MNREKIKNLINSHRLICEKISHFCNFLNFKNKLLTKGVSTEFGIVLLNGIKIYSYGKGNKIIFDDGVRIKNSKIIIHGNNNTVHIGSYSALNQVELYMEDDFNEIKIGKNTELCGKAHFATIEGTKILIGDDCLFSSDIHFRTGDSHSILDDSGKRINPSENIIIDNHVWVGTKVTCLKGVYVSCNSIVGATTTLCKKYKEQNCIIAGTPGKVLKTGINWCSKRLPMEH